MGSRTVFLTAVCCPCVQLFAEEPVIVEQYCPGVKQLLKVKWKGMTVQQKDQKEWPLQYPCKFLLQLKLLQHGICRVNTSQESQEEGASCCTHSAVHGLMPWHFRICQGPRVAALARAGGQAETLVEFVKATDRAVSGTHPFRYPLRPSTPRQGSAHATGPIGLYQKCVFVLERG